MKGLRLKKTRNVPLNMRAVRKAALAVCAFVAAAGVFCGGFAYAGGWLTFAVSVESAVKMEIPDIGFDASLVHVSGGDLDMSGEQTDLIMSLLDGGAGYLAAQSYLLSVAGSGFDGSMIAASGEAYILNYLFAYRDADGNYPDVYARFGLSSDVENAAAIGGGYKFFVQSLSYYSGGAYTELPRLNADQSGLYCYYPEVIHPGDVINLQYLLYFPDGYEGALPAGELISYDLIRACNNNSMLDWNVVISGGQVAPYHEDLAAAPVFIPYASVLTVADENVSLGSVTSGSALSVSGVVSDLSGADEEFDTPPTDVDQLSEDAGNSDSEISDGDEFPPSLPVGWPIWPAPDTSSIDSYYEITPAEIVFSPVLDAGY